MVWRKQQDSGDALVKAAEVEILDLREKLK